MTQGTERIQQYIAFYRLYWNYKLTRYHGQHMCIVRYFQGTEYSSQNTNVFSRKKAVAGVGVKCVKFVHWLPTIRVHKLAIVAILQAWLPGHNGITALSLGTRLHCPPPQFCF